MNINESIKEQELYLQHSDQWTHERLDEAIRLGIEALKRIKKSRGDASRYYIGYLPGETEE